MLRLIVTLCVTVAISHTHAAELNETCATASELTALSNRLEELINQRLDAIDRALAELVESTATAAPTRPAATTVVSPTTAPRQGSYLFVATPMRWIDARDHCRSLGGDLASIHSTHDEAQLRTTIPDPTSAYWIGIHDFNNDGVVVWSDGSPIDFEPTWGPDHPQKGECGAFNDRDNFWWDIPCQIHAPFVCQVVDETQPLVETTGELVFVAEALQWEEALQHCRGLGGDFPSIHDAATEERIRTLGESQGEIPGYWIGLSDSDMDARPEWSDRTPLDYVGTWGSGDPQAGECGAFNIVDDLWWDAPCIASYPFICLVRA